MIKFLLFMAVSTIIGFAGIGIALRQLASKRYQVLGALLYGAAILILMVVSLGYTL